MQERLLSRLTSPGDRPQVVCHDASWANLRSLVGAGFGVSLVQESDVDGNLSGVVYREVRDGTGPSWVGYSAQWRDDDHNPALVGFLKVLGDRYRSSPI
jgi:DNA-binding transcriptional LysR family regulator